MSVTLKFLKKGIFLSLLALLASCATGSPEEESPVGPSKPVVVLPEIELTKYEEILTKVRESNQFKRFVNVGSMDYDVGLSHYKGLDKIVALRQYLLMESKQKLDQNLVLVVGGNNSSIGGNVLVYDCRFNQLGCSTKYTGSENPQKVNSSTATLNLFFQNFAFGNTTTTTPMGFGFNSQANYYVAESDYGFLIDLKAFERAVNQANAQIKQPNVKTGIFIYDLADGLRFGGTFSQNSFLDNSSIIPNNTIYNGNQINAYKFVGEMANSLKSLLAFNKDKKIVLVMPTGTVVKYDANWNVTSVAGASNNQASYGYYTKAKNMDFNAESQFGVSTQSFITGSMIQWLEHTENSPIKQNNVALALPVTGSKAIAGENGKDFTYKPFDETVLPGSLGSYAFSVPLRIQLLSPTTNNGVVTGNSAELRGASGRISAMMLGSYIHTLGSLLEDNEKAISLLKSNFTLKQYGVEQQNFSSNSGNLYKIDENNIFQHIEANSVLQSEIIAYFDRQIAVNGGSTIYDPSVPGQVVTFDPNNKWNSIKTLFASNPAAMSQFITNSDVIVCQGPCVFNDNGTTNIVSMNGIHGTVGDFTVVTSSYQYFDVNGDPQTGVSTIYQYQGTTIPSNVFGNGIVDFTSVYNTKIAGTNHSIFNSKARISSVFGNSFESDSAKKALSGFSAQLTSVYEGMGEDATTISFASSFKSKNKVKDLRANAIESFVQDKTVSDVKNINLGLTTFGFGVIKESYTSNAKVFAVSRFDETNFAKADFTDFKGFISNTNQDGTSDIKNIGISFLLSSEMRVGFLAEGLTLQVLQLETRGERETTSMLSSKTGFRQSYKGFIDIFDDSENITGSSFIIKAGENYKINTIFAAGSKENSLTGENENSSIGLIEGMFENEKTSIKVTTGAMVEQGKMLGSEFSGGFAIEKTTTAFASISAEQIISGGMFVNGGFEYGISKVDIGANSLFKSFNNIHSSSFNLGFGYRGFFGGTLSFNYSSGLKAGKTSASVFNGVEVSSFYLNSNGLEQNFEFSFATLQNSNQSLKFAIIHTEDASNIKGERQNIIAIKASKKW